MFQFIKNLFSNKKLKDAEDEIFSLKLALVESNRKQEGLISDFIFILNDIQEGLVEPGQWKHLRLVAQNKIGLAMENYNKKIEELNLNN